MSELFEHFKAQKECDVYYLHDSEYFGDTEDKVKLPSIENSEVYSVFDDTWDLITDGGGHWDPLRLESFCNGFISFRRYDANMGIDYSLLPYIDFIYKSKGSDDEEWGNLVSYGKKVVEKVLLIFLGRSVSERCR